MTGYETIKELVSLLLWFESLQAWIFREAFSGHF
jgi:hypothetical protein